MVVGLAEGKGPDKKQGTWRNFCTQEGLAGPCSVSPSPQHHTHTQQRPVHTSMHTQIHIYIHLYMHSQACMQAHIQAHTNTCTCICAHTQPWGRGSPRLFGRPSSLPPRLDQCSISSTGPPPGGCHMPVRTVCVCVCVCARARAPQENEQVPQTTGEGGPSVCRGFTSSPQAGSRHTVAGGQERLERLQKPATRATQGLG